MFTRFTRSWELIKASAAFCARTRNCCCFRYFGHRHADRGGQFHSAAGSRRARSRGPSRRAKRPRTWSFCFCSTSSSTSSSSSSIAL